MLFVEAVITTSSIYIILHKTLSLINSFCNTVCTCVVLQIKLVVVVPVLRLCWYFLCSCSLKMVRDGALVLVATRVNVRHSYIKKYRNSPAPCPKSYRLDV